MNIQGKSTVLPPYRNNLSPKLAAVSLQCWEMQLPHMMPAGKRGKLILSRFLCEAGLKSYFRHGGKVPSPSGCRQLWGYLAPVHLGERISAVLMSVYTSCCWKKRVQSMHHSPLLHPCILWGELIQWLHPGSSCELHSCATTLETSSTTA